MSAYVHADYATPVAQPVTDAPPQAMVMGSYPPDTNFAAASAPTLYGVNEGAVRDFLAKHHWPYGLTDAVVDGLKTVPYRCFICDDSGSMNESDGNRLVS
jgi:hypothetical protein